MVSPTSLQTHGVEVNKNNRAIVLVIYSDNRSTFENNETLPPTQSLGEKETGVLGITGVRVHRAPVFFCSGGNQ